MAAKPAYIWDGSAWVQLIAADAINGQGVPTGGTSGQYLKKNSSTDYDTLWADAPVTSLTGTTNQVNVSSSTGAITLSLPQSIATTSSPSFSSLTLSGDIAVNGGDITSTATTFNLLNSTVTTLNINTPTSLSTTVNIGPTGTATGTVNIANSSLAHDINIGTGAGAASTIDIGTSSQSVINISGTTIQTSNIGVFSTASDANVGVFGETTLTTDTSLRANFTNASYSGNMIRMNMGRSGTSAASFFVGYSNWSATQDLEINLRGDGRISSDVAAVTPADYAEYFEWLDGNPNNEDRVGHTVKLVDNKIDFAEVGDQIVGVVSARPAIIGDSAWSHWTDKYLKDRFGREIMEDYQVIQWNNENGDIIAYDEDKIPEDVVVPENHWFVTQQRQSLNPDFDPNVEYIPREDRKEWSPVGLLGKLRVFKGQPVNPNWIKMRDIDDQVEEWLVR